MGYDFTIKGGFRVKAEGTYPWPCKDEPNRVMDLYPWDVLTKSEDGTYMKHTGLGTLGHVLTDDQVEPIGRDVALRLL